MAPKEASKLYDKGVKNLRKDKPKKAAKFLEQAVAIYPDYASAWTALGEARSSLGDAPGAAQAFDRAIEIDPKYIRPYVSAAQFHLGQRHWDEAVSYAGRGLDLNPYLTQARWYQALAHYRQRDYAAARRTLDEIRRFGGSDHLPTTYNMEAAILAKEGEFEKAAGEYHRALAALPDDSQQAADVKQRLHDWQELGVIAKGSAGR
jgi:tetratricopeptide (TPR) repeat protein